MVVTSKLIMVYQLFSIDFLVITALTFVEGQGSTYQLGGNVYLPCRPTTIMTGEIITWMDVDEGLPIYSIAGPSNNTKTFAAAHNNNYDNFELDNNYPNSVNLMIESLNLNNAGRYRCVFLTEASPPDFEVNVKDALHRKKWKRDMQPIFHPGVTHACVALKTVVIVSSLMVLLLVLLLFSWKSYWYMRRGRIDEGVVEQDKARSVNQVNGYEGSGNTAYLALGEVKTDNDTITETLEIPEKNINLISLLPGTGILQYYEAMLTRASGYQDVVVKTLSDDSTLKVNKVLRSEVRHILKLPENDNILKLIGWCDIAPNYIIYEFLNGKNLSNHLKEEFSAQELHQYHNTKRKRFVVTEKEMLDYYQTTHFKWGEDYNFWKRMEVRLNYKGRVASDCNGYESAYLGIIVKYCPNFVTPGLRAKKVLMDTSGRCKLYEFVSLQNADKWCTLIWNEVVPFQWMPPEFLFLETISSAGDIWSFGVLLWEIFSYGHGPYIGQERSDVEKTLREGEHLSLPINCPGAIWQLMITCWELNVEKRANIDEIIYRLISMCDEDGEYQQIGESDT